MDCAFIFYDDVAHTVKFSLFFVEGDEDGNASVTKN